MKLTNFVTCFLIISNLFVLLECTSKKGKERVGSTSSHGQGHHTQGYGGQGFGGQGHDAQGNVEQGYGVQDIQDSKFLNCRILKKFYCRSECHPRSDILCIHITL
uniref:Candidate secreted effector n=1 Tax=Meloidogyne incognita TaxID=6306 RepID=A0A914L2K7_MELIC